MVFRRFRLRGATLFAGGLALILLTAGPASAQTPLDWVDPNYPGSVTDAASITQMALNNATATGAGAAATEGCISTATVPVVRSDSESYTGLAVVSRVTLYTNAYCSEHWQMQYFNTRDYKWYPIGSVSIAGGSNTYFVTELRAGCIAGTWLYRVKGNSWYTHAVRHTCSDPNDPFRIDS